MKKIIGFIAAILIAYLAAFYIKGKPNGYDKPFDLSMLDSLFSNSGNIGSETNNDILNGEELLNSNKYDQALIVFLDALNDEDNAVNNYYVGHTYFLKDDYENALYYCGNAIAWDAAYANAYLDRGKAYYFKGYYTEAINDLYFNTELTPENPEAYYYLGLCYENQGQQEPALQSLQTAIKYDSLNTDYLFRAGFITYDMKKYKESRDYYKKLLSIDSTHKFSLINLGLTYGSLGETDSSLLMYDKTISLYPDYSLVYNNKAYIYQSEKKYAEAVKLYDKAIELDPNDTRPLWNRAECYKSVKNYTAAIQDLKKVYEMNSSYYNTLYSIAECYELMKDKTSALMYYEKFKLVASSESEYFSMVDEKINKLK